jgi:hypothetical protein
MKLVVPVVNFIRSQGLNHRQFQSFLSEIYAEYGDILYHTDVQRMSRGTVLKRLLASTLETEMFMNEKGKNVAEISDEK